MRKRILSLILIFVLTACSICAFSAETEAVNTEYERVQGILDAVGVFDRYDSAKGFEERVSRAELISLCMAVIFPEITYNAPESPFNDVKTSDYSYEHICSAYKIGIISGGEDKKFRPNEAVTYDEALKILTSLLGYDPVAEAKGGYPAGYRSVAKLIHLDSGISDSAKADIRYGDCLIMLLNALDTEINEINTISQSDGMTFIKGETLMYNAFRIRKDSGVLTENGYTTLTGGKDSNDYSVRIGDFSGKSYGGTHIENYLGYDVEFYYREDSVADYVVYMEPSGSNKVTYISSEDDVKTADKTISWFPNTGKSRKSVTLPNSVKIIYNGKAYPEYTMDIFERADADFYLVDNNGDGKIDVVNITAWGSIFVHGIDLNEEIITDKYDNGSKIDLKDADDPIIWNSKFEQLKLSDLSTGVVANYVKSIDSRYVRIIITDNKKSGKITLKTTKNGNTVLALDGSEYIVADSYAKKVSALPEVGATVTIYTDYTGRIAAIESGSDEFKYGYIIAASKGSDVFGDSIMIRFMNNGGSISALETDEKFKVDGERYKDSMFDDMNTPQVIRYKLSDDNKIKEIDTIFKGENESENSLRALTDLVTMKFYPAKMVFAGSGQGVDYNGGIYYCQLVPDENTRLIIAPNPDAEGKMDDDYSIQPISYITDDSVTKVFRGFNANVDSYIPDVVYMQNDGNGNLSRGLNATLVTEVCEALNSDGVVVTRIKVVDYKDRETALCFSENLNAKKPDIAVGDFINYTVDMRGDITDLNIVYSNKLRKFHPDNKYGIEYFGSNFNPYYGKAYDREGNVIAFTTAENLANVTWKDIQFVPVTNGLIFVVDKNRKGSFVKRGTAEDVYDYKHYGTGSDIFIYNCQAAMRMMIIYR